MVRVSLRASSNGKLYDLDVSGSMRTLHLLESTMATAVYFEGIELRPSMETIADSILAATKGITDMESAASLVLTPHQNNSLLALGDGETGPATAMPKILPHGGEFVNKMYISLACASPDARIYYTLDGSMPSMSSRVYFQPLSVGVGTTIITACALCKGRAPSKSVSAKFVGQAPRPSTVHGSRASSGREIENSLRPRTSDSAQARAFIPEMKHEVPTHASPGRDASQAPKIAWATNEMAESEDLTGQQSQNILDMFGLVPPSEAPAPQLKHPLPVSRAMRSSSTSSQQSSTSDQLPATNRNGNPSDDESMKEQFRSMKSAIESQLDAAEVEAKLQNIRREEDRFIEQQKRETSRLENLSGEAGLRLNPMAEVSTLHLRSQNWIQNARKQLNASALPPAHAAELMKANHALVARSPRRLPKLDDDARKSKLSSNVVAESDSNSGSQMPGLTKAGSFHIPRSKGMGSPPPVAARKTHWSANKLMSSSLQFGPGGLLRPADDVAVDVDTMPDVSMFVMTLDMEFEEWNEQASRKFKATLGLVSDLLPTDIEICKVSPGSVVIEFAVTGAKKEAAWEAINLDVRRSFSRICTHLPVVSLALVRNDVVEHAFTRAIEKKKQPPARASAPHMGRQASLSDMQERGAQLLQQLSGDLQYIKSRSLQGSPIGSVRRGPGSPPPLFLSSGREAKARGGSWTEEKQEDESEESAEEVGAEEGEMMKLLEQAGRIAEEMLLVVEAEEEQEERAREMVGELQAEELAVAEDTSEGLRQQEDAEAHPPTETVSAVPDQELEAEPERRSEQEPASRPSQEHEAIASDEEGAAEAVTRIVPNAPDAVTMTEPFESEVEVETENVNDLERMENNGADTEEANAEGGDDESVSSSRKVAWIDAIDEDSAQRAEGVADSPQDAEELPADVEVLELIAENDVQLVSGATELEEGDSADANTQLEEVGNEAPDAEPNQTVQEQEQRAASAQEGVPQSESELAAPSHATQVRSRALGFEGREVRRRVMVAKSKSKRALQRASSSSSVAAPKRELFDPLSVGELARTIGGRALRRAASSMALSRPARAPTPQELFEYVQEQGLEPRSLSGSDGLSRSASSMQLTRSPSSRSALRSPTKTPDADTPTMSDMAKMVGGRELKRACSAMALGREPTTKEVWAFLQQQATERQDSSLQLAEAETQPVARSRSSAKVVVKIAGAQLEDRSHPLPGSEAEPDAPELEAAEAPDTQTAFEATQLKSVDDAETQTPIAEEPAVVDPASMERERHLEEQLEHLRQWSLQTVQETIAESTMQAAAKDALLEEAELIVRWQQTVLEGAESDDLDHRSELLAVHGEVLLELLPEQYSRTLCGDVANSSSPVASMLREAIRTKQVHRHGSDPPAVVRQRSGAQIVRLGSAHATTGSTQWDESDGMLSSLHEGRIGLGSRPSSSAGGVTDEQDDAAVKIQSGIRGMMERKRVTAVKEGAGRESVQAVQALAREEVVPRRASSCSALAAITEDHVESCGDHQEPPPQSSIDSIQDLVWHHSMLDVPDAASSSRSASLEAQCSDDGRGDLSDLDACEDDTLPPPAGTNELPMNLGGETYVNPWQLVDRIRAMNADEPLDPDVEADILSQQIASACLSAAMLELTEEAAWREIEVRDEQLESRERSLEHVHESLTTEEENHMDTIEASFQVMSTLIARSTIEAAMHEIAIEDLAADRVLQLRNSLQLEHENRLLRARLQLEPESNSESGVDLVGPTQAASVTLPIPDSLQVHRGHSQAYMTAPRGKKPVQLVLHPNLETQRGHSQACMAAPRRRPDGETTEASANLQEVLRSSVGAASDPRRDASAGVEVERIFGQVFTAEGNVQSDYDRITAEDESATGAEERRSVIELLGEETVAQIELESEVEHLLRAGKPLVDSVDDQLTKDLASSLQRGEAEVAVVIRSRIAWECTPADPWLPTYLPAAKQLPGLSGAEPSQGADAMDELMEEGAELLAVIDEQGADALRDSIRDGRSEVATELRSRIGAGGPQQRADVDAAASPDERPRRGGRRVRGGRAATVGRGSYRAASAGRRRIEGQRERDELSKANTPEKTTRIFPASLETVASKAEAGGESAARTHLGAMPTRGEDDRADAAVKIQSGLRGMRDRKSAGMQRGDTARHTKEQENVDSEATEDKTEAAAVKIQAGLRGMHARKHTAVLRDDSQPSVRNEALAGTLFSPRAGQADMQEAATEDRPLTAGSMTSSAAGLVGEVVDESLQVALEPEMDVLPNSAPAEVRIAESGDAPIFLTALKDDAVPEATTSNAQPGQGSRARLTIDTQDLPDQRKPVSDEEIRALIEAGRQLLVQLPEQDAMGLIAALRESKTPVAAKVRGELGGGEEGGEVEGAVAELVDQGRELLARLGGEQSEALLQAILRPKSPVAHKLHHAVARGEEEGEGEGEGGSIVLAPAELMQGGSEEEAAVKIQAGLRGMRVRQGRSKATGPTDEEIQALIRAGRELLPRLSEQDASDLMSALRDSEAPVAAKVRNELQSRSEGQADLDSDVSELVDQGRELLSRLDSAQSEALLRAILRPKSPVAHALCGAVQQESSDPMQRSNQGSRSRLTIDTQDLPDQRKPVSDEEIRALIEAGRQLLVQLPEQDAMGLIAALRESKTPVAAKVRGELGGGEEGGEVEGAVAELVDQGRELLARLGGEQSEALLQAILRPKSPVAHKLHHAVARGEGEGEGEGGSIAVAPADLAHGGSEEEAAVKIQAGLRGMHARKQTAVLRDGAGQIDMDKVVADEAVDAPGMTFSARGLVNKVVDESLEEALETPLDDTEEATDLEIMTEGASQEPSLPETAFDHSKGLADDGVADIDQQGATQVSTPTQPTKPSADATEAAAVKIQAGLRGMHARKHTAVLRDDSQPSVRNEALAGTLFSPRAGQADMQEAAAEDRPLTAGSMTSSAAGLVGEVVDESLQVALDTPETEAEEIGAAACDEAVAVEPFADAADAETAAAAVKIQAGMRGMRDRKMTATQRSEPEREPAVVNAALAGELFSPRPAPTDVMVDGAEQAQVAPTTSSEEEEAAAVKIQSGMRGLMERKKAAADRDEQAKAREGGSPVSAASSRSALENAALTGMLYSPRPVLHGDKDADDRPPLEEEDLMAAMSRTSSKVRFDVHDPPGWDPAEENAALAGLLLSPRRAGSDPARQEGGQTAEQGVAPLSTEPAADELEELESAAIKIQSGMRGMRERKKRLQRQDTASAATAASDLSPGLDVSTDSWSERQDAAVKIQSGMRGMRDRKRALRRQDTGAFGSTDFRIDRTPSLDRTEQAAAVKIQSGMRGMRDRKKAQLKRKDTGVSLPAPPNSLRSPVAQTASLTQRQDAAVKIQSGMRGMRDRKRALQRQDTGAFTPTNSIGSLSSLRSNASEDTNSARSLWDQDLSSAGDDDGVDARSCRTASSVNSGDLSSIRESVQEDLVQDCGLELGSITESGAEEEREGARLERTPSSKQKADEAMEEGRGAEGSKSTMLTPSDMRQNFRQSLSLRHQTSMNKVIPEADDGDDLEVDASNPIQPKPSSPETPAEDGRGAPDAAVDEDRQAAAATKIQSGMRGMRDRKKDARGAAAALQEGAGQESMAAKGAEARQQARPRRSSVASSLDAIAESELDRPQATSSSETPEQEHAEDAADVNPLPAAAVDPSSAIAPDAAKDNDAETAAAAVKIQAGMRGMRDRKRTATQRSEADPAMDGVSTDGGMTEGAGAVETQRAAETLSNSSGVSPEVQAAGVLPVASRAEASSAVEISASAPAGARDSPRNEILAEQDGEPSEPQAAKAATAEARERKELEAQQEEMAAKIREMEESAAQRREKQRVRAEEQRQEVQEERMRQLLESKSQAAAKLRALQAEVDEGREEAEREVEERRREMKQAAEHAKTGAAQTQQMVANAERRWEGARSEAADKAEGLRAAARAAAASMRAEAEEEQQRVSAAAAEARARAKQEKERVERQLEASKADGEVAVQLAKQQAREQQRRVRDAKRDIDAELNDRLEELARRRAAAAAQVERSRSEAAALEKEVELKAAAIEQQAAEVVKQEEALAGRRLARVQHTLDAMMQSTEFSAAQLHRAEQERAQAEARAAALKATRSWRWTHSSGGKVYWWNKKTREKSWKTPRELLPLGKDLEQIRPALYFTKSTAATPAVGTPASVMSLNSSFETQYGSANSAGDPKTWGFAASSMVPTEEV